MKRTRLVLQLMQHQRQVGFRFPLFVLYQIMLSNNEFARDAIFEKAENFLGGGGVKVSISFILATINTSVLYEL